MILKQNGDGVADERYLLHLYDQLRVIKIRKRFLKKMSKSSEVHRSIQQYKFLHKCRQFEEKVFFINNSVKRQP